MAHELGHYLLHRLVYPDGIRCGEQDVVRWDSAYGQVEHQANVFAANVLMPLDDYRKLITPRTKITLEMVSAAANRYRISLVAAILRWLSYTERRAVLRGIGRSKISGPFSYRRGLTNPQRQGGNISLTSLRRPFLIPWKPMG